MINGLMIQRKSVDVLPITTELYKEGPEKSEKIAEYLKKNGLPKISKEKSRILNSPIAPLEVQQAIQRAKIGNTPGLVGLPATYYKKMEEILFIPLKDTMNDVLTNGILPHSFPNKVQILQTLPIIDLLPCLIMIIKSSLMSCLLGLK